MDNEAIEFIKALEEKHNAKVAWRTYATWFADSYGTLREYGVFLYRCGDVLYYEDFERKPSILGFPLRPGKNAKPYVKYEGSIPLDEIRETKLVTRKTAMSVASGSLQASLAPQASALQKVFAQLVEMVITKNGAAYFFELMNRKEFHDQLTR